jgi:hypothetical protein
MEECLRDHDTIVQAGMEAIKAGMGKTKRGAS